MQPICCRTEEVIDAQSTYILGALDDADIEWMAACGKRVEVKADECLIRKGAPIESLFVLLECTLSVRVGAHAESEVAQLLPGEIVGEISFVDERQPTASVIAIRDSRLLAMGKPDLHAKFRSDSGFAARFYRSIAAFLADRLYITTCRFGYGSEDQDVDLDELDEGKMDEVSLAAIRFDKLLRYLADNQCVGSFAAVKP